MFQNVINDNTQDVQNEIKRKIEIKNLFKINDIVLYAIAFLVSMVGFNKELAPFGLAIFAAACSNRIPVGILYIAVLIGTGIGFGVNGVLSFLISSLLFIAMILIFRPRMQEPEKNERQQV